MLISDDWLIESVEIEEIEEWLALGEASDLWLEEWRRFVGHFGPGDELWYFHHAEVEDPELSDWEHTKVCEGLAQVRDGEVAEWISTAWW